MGSFDFKGTIAMSEEKKKRKPLGLQVTPSVGSGSVHREQIRQSLSHGRSKSVTVEVKRKRGQGTDGTLAQDAGSKLTSQEQQLRMRAVQESMMIQDSPEIPEALPEIMQESVQEFVQEPELAVDIPEKALEETLGVEKDLGSISADPVPLPIEAEGVQDGVRKRRGFERQEEKKPKHKPRKSAPKALTASDSLETEERNRIVVGLKKLRRGHRPVRNVRAIKILHLREKISVGELASKLSEKSSFLIRNLLALGMKVTVDSVIDGDTAQLIAEERGFQVQRQDAMDREAELWNQAPGEKLVARPPVVTVMGHVDHGKTSLLDALRKTDVAGGEEGGITQHIGAYQVQLSSGQLITFLDTPGHQAFTQMRARGAKTTDIVILVVAADEGISAQTVEAIHHCAVAKAPMIVVINKMDKPGAKPDHVRQQLLQHQIVVEKLGGTVQDVEVSALKGTNLGALEEAILLQAEILGLQADPVMRAKGLILETRMKKGQGVMATVLVQEGKLSRGDFFVAGETWGKVKLLFNHRGELVKEALPSQPVEVVGFSSMPQAGDPFVIVPCESDAKEFMAWKKERMLRDEGELEESEEISILDRLKHQHVKEQPLVVKADAQGSLEGIVHELEKIQHAEVALKIVHRAVGAVNEGDVLLAQASGALILSFNVVTLPEAQKVLAQKKVIILSHRVIYHIVEDVRRILSGLLDPVYEEEKIGKAEVIQIFQLKKISVIAGCMIKEGVLRRGAYARIFRSGVPIFEGEIKSLRHVKEDVKEKAAGYECGMILEGGYCDFQLGDSVECFTKKRVQRFV